MSEDRQVSRIRDGFPCPDCDSIFGRKSTLKRHCETAHQQQKAAYTCSECQAAFPRKDGLTRHRKIHDGSGNVTCPRCGRTHRKDYFKMHWLACQKRFERKAELKSTLQESAVALPFTITWTENQSCSSSIFPFEKRPPRPITFVRDTTNHIPPGIQELDLSHDDVLFPAVQDAIASGDLQRLKDLISASPPPCNSILGLDEAYWEYIHLKWCSHDIYDAFPDQLTSCAARYGQVEIVQFLLESGVDLDSNDGRTPLEYAAEFGKDAVVEYLIEKSAVLSDFSFDCRKSLELAIAHKRRGVVRLIIEKCSLEFEWNSPLHPLWTAIQTRDSEMIELLFELGVDVAGGKKNEGWPLYLAAQGNRLATIDFLLDRGAHVDDGWRQPDETPLKAAILFNHLESVQKLIQRGASVDGLHGDIGTTPLMTASERGSHDIINFLVNNGASINLCRPKYLHESSTRRPTALTEACADIFARNGAVGLLLRHGADVNLGRPPPLENALRWHRAKTVRLLLDAGADIELVSNDCIATLGSVVDGSLEPGSIARQSSFWQWEFRIEPVEKFRLLGKYGLKPDDRELGDVTD